MAVTNAARSNHRAPLPAANPQRRPASGNSGTVDDEPPPDTYTPMEETDTFRNARRRPVPSSSPGSNPLPHDDSVPVATSSAARPRRRMPLMVVKSPTRYTCPCAMRTCRIAPSVVMR